MAAIGFTIQPEERYLELLASVMREEPDYLELAPETTWRADDSGQLVPNGFHERFQALKTETGKPFVAHGVGWSVGSVRRDPERDARWKRRIALDHALFDFQWYTDHLGASVLDGHELTLPLPLPMTADMAAIVRASLLELQALVPDVGLENSVFYYHLGDPLEEPEFLHAILSAPRTQLLLDLHNVFTTATNAGFEPDAYLALAPLERVIEIHLSGGSESDPGWLASGRRMRLDSHDAAVPEPVWTLFESVLPRCPNLRGVTLERMEGTVAEEDVALLRAELRRARRIVEASRVA